MKKCVYSEKIFYIKSLTVKIMYAIIHLQSKKKGEKAMTKQEENIRTHELLKEIIANAMDLPPECLENILERTKGMAFTNTVIKKKNKPA